MRWNRRPPPLPRRVSIDSLVMPGEAWSSREAFLEVRDGRGHQRLKAQWQIGVHLPAALGEDGHSGLCPLCGVRSLFGVPGDAADFDLREGLACRRCGINARMRHALALLLDGLEVASARVYLTEQASPGFVWLQERLPHAEGSEFGLDAARRRRLQQWFEALGGRGALVDADVTALARADASLDAIGSYDVLEHVPDYRAALREFARVLVPGGRLVLTAPFLETEQATRVRARIGADGRVEHLAPAEIHGDPVSGGVLCYYHFGWDLLDAVREAGFSRAEWVRSFVPEYAVYGLWALRAHR
jgi:SAM-dependent methyltransferase